MKGIRRRHVEREQDPPSRAEWDRFCGFFFSWSSRISNFSLLLDERRETHENIYPKWNNPTIPGSYSSRDHLPLVFRIWLRSLINFVLKVSLFRSCFYNSSRWISLLVCLVRQNQPRKCQQRPQWMALLLYLCLFLRLFLRPHHHVEHLRQQYHRHRWHQHLHSRSNRIPKSVRQSRCRMPPRPTIKKFMKRQ